MKTSRLRLTAKITGFKRPVYSNINRSQLTIESAAYDAVLWTPTPHTHRTLPATVNCSYRGTAHAEPDVPPCGVSVLCPCVCAYTRPRSGVPGRRYRGLLCIDADQTPSITTWPSLPAPVHTPSTLIEKSGYSMVFRAHGTTWRRPFATPNI